MMPGHAGLPDAIISIINVVLSADRYHLMMRHALTICLLPLGGTLVVRQPASTSLGQIACVPFYIAAFFCIVLHDPGKGFENMCAGL